MLFRVAKQVLGNTSRVPTVIAKRTLYPYQRSMVTRIKSSNDLTTNELTALNLLAFVVVLSVPGWVMYNLDSYKGIKKED